MRLSDYKGDAAIDKLAEIIEPLTAILGDPEMQEIAKVHGSAMMYVKPILKNHKQEIFAVLAALENEPVDEYKEKVTLLTLPARILEFINDPEVQALFPSEHQENVTPLPDFGAVTENTGAKEN